MRLTGSLEAASGFGLHDHLCWSYDDPKDLRERTLEFLSEGLEQGLRVCYVNHGSVQSLRRDLEELPDLERHVDRGAVSLISGEFVYRTRAVVDPLVQVEVYRSFTDEALADGYEGFRLVAEATPLVKTKEQLLSFLSYEYLVDGLMAMTPFSAMCAYNANALGSEALSALAAVHPNSRERDSQFHVYNLEGTDLALSGEIDVGVQRRFEQALERAHVSAKSAELRVDGTQLAYIDHRALSTLSKCASRSGAVAVLRTHSAMPARLVEMLQIKDIRIEQMP